jgi:muconolactone delta-isomerase
MEYFVTMTAHVPDGTSEEAVSDVRAREAVRSRDLAVQGPVLRLWRPPLQPGKRHTLGMFAAGDDGQLEKVLASMPLRVWRTDEVTPLSPHRNDPGWDLQETGAEFPPPFTPPSRRARPARPWPTSRREAERAHELAGQGRLVRLWVLPAQGRTLGLWRAPGRR